MSFSSINMRALVLLCLLQAVSGYNWNGPGGTEATASSTNVCLNDQKACGCCLIQKQMKRLETFLNMSAQAMDSVLDNTKTTLDNLRASRSAFSVTLNDESATNCYGPYNENKIIAYKHVFINLGNGYNTQSGVFKVPRNGVYSLTVTIHVSVSAGASATSCASLRVNGNVVSAASEANMIDKKDSASIVVALKLIAGDEVDVVQPAGCVVCDSSVHYNTFTGFLLYATG